MITERASKTKSPPTIDLFKEDVQREILERLKGCNLDELSPIQALNLLAEWKSKLK